jgi:hypothetical protein
MNGMLWKGRPIEALSKEELIEVAYYLSARVQEHETPKAMHDRAVGAARRFLEAVKQ